MSSISTHASASASPVGSTPMADMIARLPDGVLIFRHDQLLFANPAALKLFGAEDAAILAQTPISKLIHGASLQALLKITRGLAEEQPAPSPMELRLAVSEHQTADVEVASAYITFDDAPAILLSLRDLAQRRSVEQKIRRQANYDALTGLPNRALFMDRLEHELIRAQRRKSRVALMFIDLDRFKWVNDTLGHQAGDELLREVSRRLTACFRKSDTVARLAGDEFTVILPDMAKGPYAERVAREILHQLATVFILEGQEAFISGSIGITVYPDDAKNLDDLIKNADSAMYKAKNDGRNAYRFFTPDMHLEALERVELEKDLRHALERNELVIHYQPIFQLQDRSVIGAESFLRWRHPTRGFVPPNVFVAVAEETGLISTITEWTLRTACAQTRLWRETHPDFFVSVNLSCKRCRDLSTDGKIKTILEESGLPPSALTLEITETIMSEDEGKAMSMLNNLKKMGVTLWLDDFGTGTSSLSVLKRLPLDGIKIDRAFVKDIATDHDATVLVEAILSLAASLKLQVIGEGVETEVQRLHLVNRGCLLAQGYLFGKPQPKEIFQETWLDDTPTS